MMYFIERPNTWRAANKKCAEVIEYVDQFRNCLISDELSRDALIQELRHKVKELNDKYPRTRRLIVNYSFGDFISCYPEGQHVDEYVFTINLHSVLKTYRFAEKNTLKEGGQS